MRRLIALATLAVLLFPAAAFAIPPDWDPAAGDSESYATVILLPAPTSESASNEGERDPAPGVDDGEASAPVDDGSAGREIE